MTTTSIVLSRQMVRDRIERIVVKVLHCKEVLCFQVAEIQALLDGGAPEAMGQTVEAFLYEIAERISYSGSHLFALVAQRKALLEVGATEKMIQDIPESSAKLLARLPKEYRQGLVWSAAKAQPKDFKVEYDKLLQEKCGIVKDEWRTLRLPEGVYDHALEAQAKVARLLNLDLTGEDTRTANLIAVWEGIFAFVNTTPDERFMLEVEGGS